MPGNFSQFKHTILKKSSLITFLALFLITFSGLSMWHRQFFWFNIQWFTLKSFFNKEFEYYNMVADENYWVGIAAMLILFGQLILIVNFFTNNRRKNILLIRIGISLYWVGLIYFLVNKIIGSMVLFWTIILSFPAVCVTVVIFNVSPYWLPREKQSAQ